MAINPNGTQLGPSESSPPNPVGQTSKPSSPCSPAVHGLVDSDLSAKQLADFVASAEGQGMFDPMSNDLLSCMGMDIRFKDLKAFPQDLSFETVEFQDEQSKKAAVEFFGQHVSSFGSMLNFSEAGEKSVEVVEVVAVSVARYG